VKNLPKIGRKRRRGKLCLPLRSLTIPKNSFAGLLKLDEKKKKTTAKNIRNAGLSDT